ncbi:MAG: TonB-dependent receptor [Terracidiphilus sp.]|nr:TonB-dependent receptor [Terracidiphilus sp.]MDR3775566.1 TonB-dependent receptor [Terracidiphilus sp.]
MKRSALLSFFTVAVLLLSAFSVKPAQAQETKGSIAGSTTDISQAILPGALLELQPLGKKTVSDAQGFFRLGDIAQGDYTLKVSYVGFAPLTMRVKIVGGQTTNVNLTLLIESPVDQIIVSGERLHGEAEAINIQRTADDIVQVLPSQVIMSLPNTNVADAVGRLPSVTLERDEGEGKYVQIRGTEPRLSNTTIDGVNVPSPEGNVRNIKLDIIPSGLVDRIEVSKTLSANQDGDAIGGSVNLVTKTAGDKLTYSFGGQGGYTPIQGGRALDNFDGTIGKRFGASKRLGALLSGTYDWNGRGIDDLEPYPYADTYQGMNIVYFQTADLRTYKYDRTRYGFGGGLDYTFSQKVNGYLRGLYSDFHDYGDTWVYTPTVTTISGGSGDDIIKSVVGTKVTFLNPTECDAFNNDPARQQDGKQCSAGNYAYRHYIRRPDQQIFSIETGLHQNLGATLISYEVAGARSHNIGGQDFATSSFQGPNADLAADSANPRRPQFPVLDGTNVLDAASYGLSGVKVPIKSHTTQLNFQGAVSASRNYTVNAHYGMMELGLKIRNAHKTQSEIDQSYSSPSSGLTLDKVMGSYSNSSYYDNSYKFGPLSDYNKLLRQYQTNPGVLGAINMTKSHLSGDPSTYEANERVYAGYAMNTISFSRFKLQGGVRIEATDANYNAQQVNLSDGSYLSTTPVTGNSGYISVLPSVQLQYRIDSNTTMRASYGRGISRPNFSDIVPSVLVDPNTTPPSLVEGNPALKPTSANNYDVLVEHFFQPLGVLQAGFFYKDLSDPIYSTVSNVSGGSFNGYRLNQSINGPKGHITGIEAAWEQRLSRLPWMLNGLGVSANYSYTASQVTFPTGFSGGRNDHAALQRQAPNTWNLGMTYDKARFSMRFDASHNDANIYAYNYSNGPSTVSDPILGLKGPGGDVYMYAHTQYDVQGSYRLHKGLQAVVSGLNLSNEVFGFYQGSAIYPIQREYYHPTVNFGLRWTPGVE